MRQTVIGLVAGQTLDKFGSPADATVLVLRGRVEWSLDGSRAYYNDTAVATVGKFGERPQVGQPGIGVVVEHRDGERPDGLTVGAEGGVWSAVSNGGAIYRYSPDGVLDAKRAVPVRKVTACTCGGERLDEPFITQENIVTGEDPLAGSLFRADLGVSRLPVRLFAG